MSKVLRLPQAIERTGLSKSTIYSLEAKGQFPSRAPLGPRSVGWLESEINDWIDSRFKARNIKEDAK